MAIGAALAVLASAITSTPAQAAATDLTLVYQIDGPGRGIYLPLQGTVAATVDWGDGTVESINSPGWWGHTYWSAGEVTISISGTVTQLGVGPNWLDSNQFLRKITSWGDVGLTSLSGVLRGAWYATEVPSTLPSTVTDLSYAFSYTQQFNQDLSGWDTSNVTSMYQMFLEAQTFNQDIGGWNISKVTDTSYMFYNAYRFNQDISAWDTSAVTTMSHMFRNAQTFNQDISAWDTSNVTDMSRMFEYAVNFNQPLAGWDTSKVTDLSGMFFVANNFNQDLSSWNTSAVTNLSYLFFESAFNSDISTWDTSNVTNFDGTFLRAYRFNQSIADWDTSSGTSMVSMFENAQSFDQDISAWDVSHVVNMTSMFRDARSFNHDIGGWNTASLRYLDYEFAGAIRFDQDISGWNVSQVTSMAYVFAWTEDFNSPLEGWDTGNVTNFEGMFYVATRFDQPLQLLDTSSAVNMSSMFSHAFSFNQPLVQDPDLGGWDTSNVENMNCMFYNARTFNQPVDSWDTAKVRWMNCMFGNAISFNQPIPETEGGWSTASVVSMDSMFDNADAFNSDISTWNTSSLTWANRMFFNTDLFNQDISAWDVSKLTSAELMFSYTQAFDSPLEGWNLASLQNANGMFHNAQAFNQPLAAWNTSSVRWMNDMFSYTRLFNQDISSWDVSQVESMHQMFREADAFDQPVEAWDVSNVTNMNAMFTGTDKFDQPLNGWNVSNVRYMGEMFNGARMFDQPLGDWDTAKVEQMQSMFSNGIFNQDISRWDTGNVRYMNWMFANNPEFNQPIDDWNTSNVGDMPGMFYRAVKFNQPIYKWDVSRVFNFEHMFHDAYAFDQDLSAWNTANGGHYYETFNYSGMSQAHYSAFLESLAYGTPERRNSVRLDSTMKYFCGAADARAKLIDDKFWWIGDWGMAECKTEQSITFDDPADFAVNKVKLLSATASSGLPVTFKWISGPCELAGNKLEATGLGVCVVGARQAGNAEFYDAAQVVRWINILDPADPDVIYDANGADSGAAPVDESSPYAAGSEITLQSGAGLVKAHHDLSGWNTKADGSGTHYELGEQITLGDRDLYLYAEWTLKPTYTLTYDANGAGSGSVPTDAGVYEPEQTTTVAGSGDLALEHFSFVEWNTAADGSGTSYAEGDTLAFVDSDVTLYAIWLEDPKYTLTYDGNGASSGSAPVAAGTFYSGTELTVADVGDLAKNHFYFVSWNTAADGSGSSYGVGDPLTITDSDVTLYAIWVEYPKYTLTYDGNGASSGSAPVAAGSFYSGTELTVAGPGSLVRANHYFIGWDTAADGSGTRYVAGDVLTIDASNVVLYAVWQEQDRHSVVYLANGADSGSVPVDANTYYEGDQVTIKSAELGRAHFDYTGWNTRADGAGTHYAAGATLSMPAAGLVLYAEWAPKASIDFTLVADGVESELLGTRRLEVGSVITLPTAEQLTRSGFVMTGWNTRANGSGIAYSAGSEYTVKLGESALYAQWDAVRVASKYKKSGVRFRANSARLTIEAKNVLRAFAKAELLGKSAGLTVRVTGFVQPSERMHPPAQLSRWRAVSVVRFLKTVGVRGTVKIVPAGVASSVKSLSRKAVVMATWDKVD